MNEKTFVSFFSRGLLFLLLVGLFFTYLLPLSFAQNVGVGTGNIGIGTMSHLRFVTIITDKTGTHTYTSS